MICLCLHTKNTWLKISCFALEYPFWLAQTRCLLKNIQSSLALQSIYGKFGSRHMLTINVFPCFNLNHELRISITGQVCTCKEFDSSLKLLSMCSHPKAGIIHRKIEIGKDNKAEQRDFNKHGTR